MERTPSPPRRVRTPPAPMHGARHDDYEPFSPRRSSRVAAQLHHDRHSPTTRSRTARAVTPTRATEKPVTRTSNFTLSPPSSPISPAKRSSPRSKRPSHPNPAPADSDSDHAAPTPARRFLSTMPPRGLLPTPSKTPRKRALHSEDTLGPTARVLFPNRPATVDEAMPTPRKVRKTKNVFTLESFAEQMDSAKDKIEIFTDSKERVPTRDDDEDNPFITRKGKAKAKAKAKATPQSPRRVDEKTAKMFEAAERDEGMIYLFRGKKTFRKYDDSSPRDEADDGPSSGDEVRRQAGSLTHGRITRSSVKPRLLFQEEIRRQRLENGDDDDEEEADTDIEIPVATPSRKTQKTAVVAAAQEATPPPTQRVKRQISFESWSRVKSSSSNSRDRKKRPGTPLDSPVDKRARSEHSGSAMSLDSI